MTQYFRRHSLLVALVLALLLLWGWSREGVAVASTPAHQLQSAWIAAAEIGQVAYRTVTVQTITPTERLDNVGRRAVTRRMEVTGALDRPGESARMQMRSGPQVNQQVMDLKLEGGLAYGRLSADEDWRQLDGIADFFAPGGDLLGYLAAANNVREITPPQPSPLRGGSSSGTSPNTSVDSETLLRPNEPTVPSPEWGGLGWGTTWQV